MPTKTSKRKPPRSKKPAKVRSGPHRVNCLTPYLQAGIPLRKPQVKARSKSLRGGCLTVFLQAGTKPRSQATEPTPASGSRRKPRR